MADQHPPYKIYADQYFLTKAAHEKYMEGFQAAFAEGVFKMTDALHGRIKKLEGKDAANLARIEELENELALLRALKPARKEDA